MQGPQGRQVGRIRHGDRCRAAAHRHGRQRGQCLVALRRAGLQQAVQVQRTTRLGAGARQPHAAKRLHADHRANHVAVDVDVAGLHFLRHLGNGLVDAAVHAKGQAIAGGVQRIEHLAQLVAAVAQHMQHRAEDFALQALDAVDLDQRRHHEMALGPAFVAPHAGHGLAFGLHLRNVLLDLGAGVFVNHRADVGVHAVRVAHDPFAHGVLDHVHHALRAVFLQAQQAQCRTALAGGIERRRQHVAHQLLGQRRRVGHQRVLAAGFSNQRNRVALRAQAFGQRLRNQP